MLLKENHYYRITSIENNAFKNKKSLYSISFSDRIENLPLGIGVNAFLNISEDAVILMNEKLYQHLDGEQRIQNSSIDSVPVLISEVRTYKGFRIQGNRILGIDIDHPPELENDGKEFIVPKIPDMILENEDYQYEIDLDQQQSLITSYSYNENMGKIPSSVNINKER